MVRGFGMVRVGEVEGQFISVGNSGPMLKISWISIKIWPRYEGLKLRELITCSGGHPSKY